MMTALIYEFGGGGEYMRGGIGARGPGGKTRQGVFFLEGTSFKALSTFPACRDGDTGDVNTPAPRPVTIHSTTQLPEDSKTGEQS